MNSLIVNDVRCFRDKVQAPVAPLTLLVGENSTGKSTFMSLVRIAWDLAHGMTSPDFNEPPFQLGSYSDIAHYHGGQGKRAKSFSVGSIVDLPGGKGRPQEARVVGTFVSDRGQPSLSNLNVDADPFSASTILTADKIIVRVKTPSGEFSTHFPGLVASDPFRIRHMLYAVDSLAFRGSSPNEMPLEGDVPSQEDLRVFRGILSFLLGFGPRRRRGRTERPTASAPIRTKPQRTYDALQATRSPEGAHVPKLLAEMSEWDEEKWQKIKEHLVHFGRDSGLFEDVIVRRFGGDRSAGPFQLKVKLRGQRGEMNLVDVGYGVSQVLPILVDCLTEEQPSHFIIQQPEVHLHPRAQAALGTFLARMVMTSRHRLVIETHSDHLLDRIRLAVRNRVLRRRDVQILFFDREAHAVAIHPIELDGQGNLVNPPDGYRDFFLHEELRVLGLE